MDQNISRRNFLGKSSLLGMWPWWPPSIAPGTAPTPDLSRLEALGDYVRPLDLSPARWIWYPSGRTLANTFILFRKELSLPAGVLRARGWILGESRYKLYVNGQRIQFGPAPSDPRFSEADPVDLTPYLQRGDNVIGAEVLYYGHGDGTWPIGKAGFIFLLDLELADGRRQQIRSDGSWQCLLCRAWPPGQYKRWYLRALQEEFDARHYPYGWSEPGFRPGVGWLQAMVLAGNAAKTALNTGYGDYLLDSSALATDTQLRERSVPMLDETRVPAWRLVNAFSLEWKTAPEDYFDMVIPDAYQSIDNDPAKLVGQGRWQVELLPGRAAVLTFEFVQQIVGWPYFTITAPAGTTVELLVQEGHDPDRRIIMNNHFHAWSRFVCREGTNTFETFDFESLRWLQLHIRNAAGTVTIERVGLRRRRFPWPQEAQVFVSDPPIQQVLEAAVNTLHNAAQDTLVDGMGRERQQYSGDIGHALHAIMPAFGDTRLPARYLNTYSQGLTKDGFFLDCWPAYDRLARLAERQLDLTPWGPLVDHGVGFVFDCWYYYQYSGDLTALREVLPRLLVFYQYLKDLRRDDGLLPVEDLGVPTVWIDHDAYRQQRHKHCAFNLYAAAMMLRALAPLCRAAGLATDAQRIGEELLRATQRRYWDEGRGLYVSNRPWLEEEARVRYDDRSLAMAVLYDLFPQRGGRATALQLLAEAPPEMGLSYPANAGWRLWALAEGGRIDAVLHELRTRWAAMDAVRLNNTLSEAWTVQPDSNSQWSHCPVAPLYILFLGIAGIRPLEPAYRKVLIRPQPGDLEAVRLTAHSPQGPVRLEIEGRPGQRNLRIELPDNCTGVLELPEGAAPGLPAATKAAAEGWQAWQLPAGGTELAGLEF